MKKEVPLPIILAGVLIVLVMIGVYGYRVLNPPVAMSPGTIPGDGDTASGSGAKGRPAAIGASSFAE